VQTREALRGRNARLGHSIECPTNLRVLRRFPVEHHEGSVERPKLCRNEFGISGGEQEREQGVREEGCRRHFFLE
jgi:hypothetical protein